MRRNEDASSTAAGPIIKAIDTYKTEVVEVPDFSSEDPEHL